MYISLSLGYPSYLATASQFIIPSIKVQSVSHALTIAFIIIVEHAYLKIHSCHNTLQCPWYVALVCVVSYSSCLSCYCDAFLSLIVWLKYKLHLSLATDLSENKLFEINQVNNIVYYILDKCLRFIVKLAGLHYQSKVPWIKKILLPSFDICN